MQIESREFDGTKLFHISGRLVGLLSRTLFAELGGLVNSDFSTIVLELSKVDFIDSLGLGTLVDLHQMFRDAGKKMVLAGPGGLVRELLFDSALGEVFEVVDTEALPVQLR